MLSTQVIVNVYRRLSCCFYTQPWTRDRPTDRPILIFYFVNVKYNELFVSVFPQMVMVEECQQRFPNVDPENTICVKKEGDVYSECNVSSIKLHWNYNRKRH